ncbi:MAG: GNAT family N-acetyltransferase [Streptococcus sp.]|nr:GNAT family N-acetyltransferase [Streptococcus sp.]
MIFAETPRLILRSWKKSDIEPFVEMNQDREMMRYFPKRYSREESLNLYQAIQKEFQEIGYSLFAVEEKKSQEFIGFVGLHQSDLEIFNNETAVEIGWRIKTDFWNQGYATEAAKTCLEFAFNEIGLKEVYSFTATVNLPSQAVMKKLGMEFLKEFDNEKVPATSDLFRHVLYRIQK